MRIASDGEVCARASISRAIGTSDETRAAFVDGWFKTGDIGNSTPMDSFHHRSQEGSDQDFRREVHRPHRSKLAEVNSLIGTAVVWRPPEISCLADRAALLSGNWRGPIRFPCYARRTRRHLKYSAL